MVGRPVLSWTFYWSRMGPSRVLYENMDLIWVSWQGSVVHIILAL